MKVDLILIGTGAAEPVYQGSGKLSFTRAHCGALIKTKTKEGRHFIKIDYTEHADFGLKRARICPSSIDTLLVSHSHEDHLGVHVFLGSKLGNLPLRLDREFTRKPLHVYAPGPTIEAMKEILARKGIFPKVVMAGQVSSYIYQSLINWWEVLSLHEVRPSQIAHLGKGVEVKFIGVRHPYSTIFAEAGKGNAALGFLITVKEVRESITLFYLTDYAQFTKKEKEAFIRSLKEEKIDLSVWGIPVPFPTDSERTEHMGFIPTLELFLDLKKEKIIAEDGPFILTHLSDRWPDPDLIQRVKLLVKNYQQELWIPARDGFRVKFEKGKMARIGKIL